MSPRLNHPLTADGISPFLTDDWIAQRKLDGVRLAVVWDAYGHPAHSISKGGVMMAPPRGLPSLPPGSVVDGEIVGESWEDSLAALRVLLDGKDEFLGQWRPFDLAAGPDGAPCEDPFLTRLVMLEDYGLSPAPSWNVPRGWEQALVHGWEGVVVRPRRGGYLSPAFKIKPSREFNAIAHRGYLHLIEPNGFPRAVGRCSDSLTGKVRVVCEGATRHGKVRAPRVTGPVAEGATVSVSQLERLVVR